MLIRTILCFALLLWAPLAMAQTIDVVQAPKGVTAWLVTDKSVPVVALNFALRGGSETDNAEKAGTAYLAAQLLEEGPAGYESSQWRQILSDKNINFSFSASRDWLVGTVYVPKTHWLAAQDLLKQLLTRPRFDDDDLARVRQQIVADLRADQSNPDWQAWRTFYARRFAGGAYATSVRGNATSLENIDEDDVSAYWQNVAQRGGVYLSASGDLSGEELVNFTANIFGDWTERALADAPQLPWPEQAPTILIKRDDLPETSLLYVWSALLPTSPDYAALTVLDYVLGGGGFSSRLMQLLRAEHGLTYGANSSLTALQQSAFISVSTAVEAAQLQRADGMIFSIIDEFKQKPLSKKQLDEARGYLLGSIPLLMTSNRDTAAMLLGWQQLKLSPQWLADYAAALKNVTPEQVRKVALELLSSPAWRIYVGKADMPNITESLAEAPL